MTEYTWASNTCMQNHQSCVYTTATKPPQRTVYHRVSLRGQCVQKKCCRGSGVTKPPSPKCCSWCTRAEKPAEGVSMQVAIIHYCIWNQVDTECCLRDTTLNLTWNSSSCCKWNISINSRNHIAGLIKHNTYRKHCMRHILLWKFWTVDTNGTQLSSFNRKVTLVQSWYKTLCSRDIEQAVAMHTPSHSYSRPMHSPASSASFSAVSA